MVTVPHCTGCTGDLLARAAADNDHVEGLLRGIFHDPSGLDVPSLTRNVGYVVTGRPTQVGP
jgi:hypothetical protein